MKEQTFIHKIIEWFFTKIGLLETREISKEEMCRKSIESGVCPKDCDRCAWNRRVKG